MAKTYRYRRYLILISSLFILLLCTDNSFTKVYAAPTSEKMLNAAKSLNLWLNEVKTCFNDVKTCYENHEYKKNYFQDRFEDLRNHFYFLESCMIEINERAKSCSISSKQYNWLSFETSPLVKCIKYELKKTKDDIERIANYLPANLNKQGTDVSDQFQTFKLSDGIIGDYEAHKEFFRNLYIEGAYVKIIKIDAKINELRAKIPELNNKIIELEAEKEQARGSNREEMGKEINNKKKEVKKQEELLKRLPGDLEGAKQKKNEICQELKNFSKDFSKFLEEMRKAYILMLEIECCIITE